MDRKPIEWHPIAIENLYDIFEFIYEESPQNAIMVHQTLTQLADSVNIFPEKYPTDKRLKNSSYRFIPIWNFKIIYKIMDDRIAILRVYSTHQNPDKLSKDLL